MVTMKNLAKRGRLIVFGLVTGLVLGPANPASAQRLLLPVDPDYLPDLTVSVSAPNSMRDNEDGLMSVTVNNQAPTKGFWRYGLGNNVALTVDFTGFFVNYVKTEDGSLTCTIRPPNPASLGGPIWNVVDCTGFIAWGSSSRISVGVHPYSLCDGRPGYTDAGASFAPSSDRERTNANNRAIARTNLGVYAAYCF
jgi:hypothetical protein